MNGPQDDGIRIALERVFGAHTLCQNDQVIKHAVIDLALTQPTGNVLPNPVGVAPLLQAEVGAQHNQVARAAWDSAQRLCFEMGQPERPENTIELRPTGRVDPVSPIAIVIAGQKRDAFFAEELQRDQLLAALDFPVLLRGPAHQQTLGTPQVLSCAGRRHVTGAHQHVKALAMLVGPANEGAQYATVVADLDAEAPDPADEPEQLADPTRARSLRVPLERHGGYVEI